jgi:hypothetical protein
MFMSWVAPDEAQFSPRSEGLNLPSDSSGGATGAGLFLFGYAIKHQTEARSVSEILATPTLRTESRTSRHR